MKTLSKYLVILITFTVVSCSKEFINRQPVSTATTDALYRTDKDFQDAVIGAYNGLRTQYLNTWQFGDLRGDDAFIQISNQPSSTGVDLFSINSSDALLSSTWANYYIVINRANTVLARIATADTSVVRNKNRYTGEAKFLRALCYFDLVRIFGNVQMITGVPTVEESARTPRTPVATIYADVILKDLQEAAAFLPRTVTGAEVGRATNGAAKALLGRVYLTLKDYTNAKAVLQEIIKPPYAYALLPNYNDLFDYTKNEHHSEYVFDVEYEEGLGGLGSNFTNGFMPNVPALLDYYGIRGGFNESISPTQLLVNLFQPVDKRKDVSVQCCGRWVNPTTGAVVTFNPSTSQSFTKKYITPVATLNDSRANWKVIRYADVLLMMAEASNETGRADSAMYYANPVRTRAGLSPFTNLNQMQLRDSIETERRLELCFEGHRWFDLLRYGKALQALAPVGMQSYMTVFPVPLSQVQVINNPTVFSQNPGYN